jgi:DNA-binding GntR family transcriptional regulator
MPAISRGPTLGHQVYAFIRDRIVNGQYQPGQSLNESELANELEVSRTPVSNAIIMLKERGLLEEQGGRPAVPQLTLKDVTDLYLCRQSLDGLAARLAAEAITDEDLAELERNLKVWEKPLPEDDRSALWVADLSFHQTIYRVADNQHLMRFAEISTELAAVYRRSTIRRLGSDQGGARTQQHIRREHQEILDALEKRDPELAERAARAHIESVVSHLRHAEVSPHALS